MTLIPDQELLNRIFVLRGHKVMLDRDLAELYGVMAKRLREQVKRNILRFPENFMFQLTEDEVDFMGSHFATPSLKRPEPSFMCVLKYGVLQSAT